MKVLDTDFGYAYPVLVIAAKCIGDPFMETYPAFKGYMKKLDMEVQSGCTHFEHKGKIYSLDKEGAEAAIHSTYGTMETIVVQTKDLKIDTNYVCIYGEYEQGKTLLPTFENHGVLYAIKDYKEKGECVGDNVSLTGGSKAYGETEKGIEVPFYQETFNAGGGRVTAGISGFYYIAEKVVAYKATTSYLL